MFSRTYGALFGNDFLQPLYTLNIIGYDGFAFTGDDAAQDFIILTASAGIKYFEADKWNITGMAGNYILDVKGNDLVLSYEAIPEPSTWALLLGGAALLAFLRRRKK